MICPALATLPNTGTTSPSPIVYSGTGVLPVRFDSHGQDARATRFVGRAGDWEENYSLLL